MIQITFQLDDKDADRLRDEAKRDGRTQSQLVRWALQAYFAEIDKKRARKSKKAA